MAGHTPETLIRRLNLPERGAAGRPLKAMQIRFYFDYISHNAYLAWCCLPDLAARHGCTVEPVPVLFAGFLKTYGQLGPAEILPKLEWMHRNNLRKAAALGVPLNAPVVHPFNPLLLLRLSHAPLPPDERARLTGTLLRAVWVDRVDPRAPDAVGRYLEAAGFDGETLLAAAGSPAAKAALKQAGEDAIAAGVFGVPSFVVDGEVFWGYDDLPWLEQYLRGEGAIDPATLEPWRACRDEGMHRKRG